MDDEEQPLLGTSISHIEPVADDQSFIVRRPSRLLVTWRQAKHLDSPVFDWLLYPVFWLALSIMLLAQSFQGVCYRSPCKICRKKSGTVDQLLASADDGCHYCSLYAEVLATMAPQIVPERGIFTITPEWWLKKFPLNLNVWNVGKFETAKFRFLTPKGTHFTFFILYTVLYLANKSSVCKEEETPNYPGSFTVPKDSGSDDCMSFALRAVADCVQHHKGCRKPNRSQIPRRVVDVCNFNVTSDVKLYESHGERGKYIALSHSWGHKHTFMTKESNLAEREGSIPLQSLPKTFQDAVFMARQLQIRYIWIDSLCIIQDQVADWEEESTKMGAIYGNAYLTIAAGSALNDETGFLGLRSDLMYRDILLKTRVQQCVSISRVQDLTAPDRRDPLSFRAWAFQERLLSRRTLYYHQQELVFECKQALRCECMSCSRVLERLRRDESTHWERLGVKYVPKSFPRVEIPKSPNMEDLCRFWCTFIVPEYSARSITRDSDRLPALSSVASAVQSLSGDKYLAGLWERSLLVDLAWNTVQNARTRTGNRVFATLPSTYVAPSWCWASVNGSVEYRNVDSHTNLTYRSSVIKAECAVVGSNPFGNVESGSIALSGPIIYGTCELQVEPDKLWPYRVKLLFPCPKQITLGFEPDVALLAECDIAYSNNNTLELGPESWLNIKTTLRREKAPNEAGPQNGLTYDQQGNAANNSISFGRVVCLLLYSILQPSRCDWVFLVLGHSNQTPGSYERLGMLTCWVNGLAEWKELDVVKSHVVTVV